MQQDRIEINFRETRQLTEELGGLAEKIGQEADGRGLEILSSSKAAWFSENADTFAGKEVKMLEKVGEISGSLSGLSEEIYERARLIYLAEQRNVFRFGN